MGENEEQKKAIEFALLQQRVDILEKWKSGYEEAQNQRWEHFEKKFDKFVETITEKINEQKSNWITRVPWYVTLLFGGMMSTIVYLLTKGH